MDWQEVQKIPCSEPLSGNQQWRLLYNKGHPAICIQQGTCLLSRAHLTQRMLRLPSTYQYSLGICLLEDFQEIHKPRDRGKRPYLQETKKTYHKEYIYAAEIQLYQIVLLYSIYLD